MDICYTYQDSLWMFIWPSNIPNGRFFDTVIFSMNICASFPNRCFFDKQLSQMDFFFNYMHFTQLQTLRKAMKDNATKLKHKLVVKRNLKLEVQIKVFLYLATTWIIQVNKATPKHGWHLSSIPDLKDWMVSIICYIQLELLQIHI